MSERTMSTISPCEDFAFLSHTHRMHDDFQELIETIHKDHHPQRLLVGLAHDDPFRMEGKVTIMHIPRKAFNF